MLVCKGDTNNRVTETLRHSSYLPYPIKDKAIPLQAWTGPEVYRSLSLPDFKIVST